VSAHACFADPLLSDQAVRLDGAPFCATVPSSCEHRSFTVYPRLRGSASSFGNSRFFSALTPEAVFVDL